MKKIFQLALLNYKNYKFSSKAIKKIMIICTVLFLLFATFSSGFAKVCSNYNVYDPTLREIVLYNTNNCIKANDLKKIANIGHVTDVYQVYQLVPMDSFTVTIDDTELVCDIMLQGINKNHSFAPEKMVLENNKNNYVDPIIEGRNFNTNDTKKAIIDENYAYILGYDSVKDVIGKKITISFFDVIVTDIEIVGVHSYIYGGEPEYLKDIDDDQRNYYLDSNQNYMPVMVSDDVIKELSRSIGVLEYNICDPLIFVDEANNVKEVCDTIEDCFEYETYSLIDIIEDRAEMVNVIRNFMYGMAVIILIISLITISNALIVKIEKQSFFTELLYKIGYSKNSIMLLYVIENMIIIIKSFVISFCIVMFVSLGVDILMSAAYREVTSYKRFLFLIDLKISGIYFIVIIIIVFLLTVGVSVVQMGRKGLYGYKK